ncbi:hypothetical protein [Erythrobacter sp. 3-20A1M]|nr:hypothetical protein [Erythrobacter sp. 3-20A1M]
MKFIKSDLFRSLAIGFLIGTAMVGISAGPDALAVATPAAIAPVAQAIVR